MVDRQQAQQIAGLKASALLLEEYEVEVADESDADQDYRPPELEGKKYWDPDRT